MGTSPCHAEEGRRQQPNGDMSGPTSGRGEMGGKSEGVCGTSGTGSSSSEEPYRRSRAAEGAQGARRGEGERRKGVWGGGPRKVWVCEKRKAQGVRYVVRGLDVRPFVDEHRDSVGVAVVSREVEGSVAILHKKGSAGE